MQYYKHKLFLRYLVFIVFVLSIFGAAFLTGILGLAIKYDKSYLVLLITCVYVSAELYIGRLVYGTSKELMITHQINDILSETVNPQFKIYNNELYVVSEGTESEATGERLESCTLVQHIKNLVSRSQHWSGKKPRLDQRVLISTLGEKIYAKNSFASTAASVVIYLGILGTVIGIIITFWPFIDTQVVLDVPKIQQNLGQVFSGVGAAFFPSAVAYLYNIFLILDDRLLISNTTELVDDITNISETYVVPVLERRDEQT